MLHGPIVNIIGDEQHHLLGAVAVQHLEHILIGRGRRLIGIVGPIGAGKSSVLDAISFALYGKTPAVEGATKTLIHQLCSESHVELRFQVDGQVWRAVRALRRRGASGHQLERLASDMDDAEVLERVTGDDPMKERVEQLLGMDFKTFCRSVLLAQNRFSEFLKATPADRDKVLKGVFGYERLDLAHVVAKGRLQREETRLEALRDRRERIDQARERLDGARSVAGAALDRHRQLEDAAPEADRLGSEIRSAQADVESSNETVRQLEAIVVSLPPPEEVEAGRILNGLGIDMIQTPENIEARPFRCSPNAAPHSLLPL